MTTKYESIADGSNRKEYFWLGNHLIVTKLDPFSNQWNKATYTDITKDQFDRWRCGELIQDAMSNLSAEDREFLITGITPESWSKTFARMRP